MQHVAIYSADLENAVQPNAYDMHACHWISTCYSTDRATYAMTFHYLYTNFVGSGRGTDGCFNVDKKIP